ncbi:MAG TPA: hydroxymethylglutaryl-CoA reductase, degradative [Clostridia bacterium]|nr:hydroxymethylglutaryl-CoA reductase, degradative [Clostridia bacterium]
MQSSQYSGFYKLSIGQRLEEVAEFAHLSEEEKQILLNTGNITHDTADHMIENVVGGYALPMGVALNFLVNGKERLIPMVVEEPSVVAAASNAAKMARGTGGFFASYTGSIMIAQIQILGVADPACARMRVYENKDKILAICNERDPVLVKFGGGARDIEVRVLKSEEGDMLVVHLLVDTLDAMGANCVNTMAETVAPFLEGVTGGKVYLRILSNLAVHRLARARATISKEALGGEDVVDGIVKAYRFAAADPFRAATHNKGIMNGISAAVAATGNDTRAIESGAHAYAAISGQYSPLSRWEKDAAGDLAGSLEMPMAVGLVGGATKTHPAARVAVKILGAASAREMAEAFAALGLAQNLAALKALATEGIQRGHMSLHARNIVSSIGVTGDAGDAIVKRMIEEKNVNAEYARKLAVELGVTL